MFSLSGEQKVSCRTSDQAVEQTVSVVVELVRVTVSDVVLVDVRVLVNVSEVEDEVFEV